MIAHIWKTFDGYLLEIAQGSRPGEFRIIATSRHATKTEAKAAAKAAGAQPWNY